MSSEELNRTCRTCAKLKSLSEMYPIYNDKQNFSVCELFASNLLLAEFLFGQLKIKHTDGLPQQICIKCQDDIKIVKDFFEQCENSQYELEKTFKQTTKPDIEFMSVEKLEYIEPEVKDSENGSDNDFDDKVVSFENESDSETNDEKLETGRFICAICSEIFQRQCDLKAHSGSCGNETETEQTNLQVENNKQNSSLKIENDDTSSSEENLAQMKLKLAATEKSDSNCVRWECHLCHKNFRIKNSLYIHIKRIHGLRKIKIAQAKVLEQTDVELLPSTYTCDLCQKSFNKKHTLYIHMKRIHSNNTHTDNLNCDICQEVFAAKNILSKHKMQVHNIAKHECPKCKEKYNSEDKYRLHLKTHKKCRQQNECKYCFQTFAQPEHLEDHEKVHTGPKPFLCTICGTNFTKRTNLKSHNRIHTGEKKFKCNLCEMGFLHRNTYIVHMQGHAGTRTMPYQCEHCGKHFGAKSGLNCHLRSHTGERPHKCDICGSGLSSKSQLVYHKKVIHNMIIENDKNSLIPKIELPAPIFIEKSNIQQPSDPNSVNPALPYVCTVCHKGFKLPFKLTNHFKMHTDAHRAYPCTHCEKSFRKLLVLQKHIEGVHLKLKPYVCHICSKSFTQKSTLTTHMITHTGAKPHICTYCNKPFGILRAMRDHMRIHTGETPYCCDICKEKFRTLKSLGAHQRNKHPNFTACSINELQSNNLTGAEAGSSSEVLPQI